MGSYAIGGIVLILALYPAQKTVSVDTDAFQNPQRHIPQER